jgi:hypothetical protein
MAGVEPEQWPDAMFVRENLPNGDVSGMLMFTRHYTNRHKGKDLHALVQPIMKAVLVYAQEHPLAPAFTIDPATHHCAPVVVDGVEWTVETSGTPPTGAIGRLQRYYSGVCMRVVVASNDPGTEDGRMQDMARHALNCIGGDFDALPAERQTELIEMLKKEQRNGLVLEPEETRNPHEDAKEMAGQIREMMKNVDELDAPAKPATLAELMWRTKAMAVQRLGDEGELETAVYCVSETVAGPFIRLPFNMPPPGPEKDYVLAMLRELFKLLDVKMYVAMAEAWSSVRPIEDAAKGYIRPSESPDRQEVVSVLGADLEGSRMASVAKMIRDGTGKPSLAAWEDDDHAGGLLASLLEPDWAAAAPAMPLNVGFPVN